MTAQHGKPAPRRVYPLDPRQLTEEQIAVAFAMTSRSPEAFDTMAQRVTEPGASRFHERWVLNYGHASIAEHAVLHMAVENISRLACDDLEDNRLASYTEQSSRYQVFGPGRYHVPAELDGHPLRDVFASACDALFDVYGAMVAGLADQARTETPRRERESERAHEVRVAHAATDSARFLLPAATLTNVGFTINARGMEHAVAKLLSSELAEERAVGQEMKEQARAITPTLIKYADASEYLAQTRAALRAAAPPGLPSAHGAATEGNEVHLVHYDAEAERKLVAALLYGVSGQPYSAVWEHVGGMDAQGRERVVDDALRRLGPHDAPIREMETVGYTFDLLLDYGAYREYKRHRMQTYLPQPLSVTHGYVVPPLVASAGLRDRFEAALHTAESAFRRVAEHSPAVAQYLVTHAHRRRVLSTMNLRECYHLFKLRTQPEAHFTLRQVVGQAMALARERHPLLFRYVQLRG